MSARFCRLVCALLAVVLPAAALAADPEGRARTWEFGATAGASFLDAGFGVEELGYTVPRDRTFPIVELDNLKSTVPSTGFRVGYTLTRWFGLELGASRGQTQVGDDSTYIGVLFLELDPSSRRRALIQQDLTVPGIARALDSIEYNVETASFTAVFNLNNRLDSRLAWYISFGGGYYGLDAKTASFNECLDGAHAIVRYADDPALAGDVNDDGHVESPEQVDLFDVDANGIIENPEHVDSFDLGCDRAFPTTRFVGATSQGEVFWVGKARFAIANAPPGRLENSGQATIGKIRSYDGSTYILGGGVRWHLKPRHIVRADFKRHFDEGNNKNVNEFNFGYSYLFGRGHGEAGAAPAPAPPAGGTPPQD